MHLRLHLSSSSLTETSDHIMDAVKAAELNEYLSRSSSDRLDRQEEETRATGCAVQALVAQVPDLTFQLQHLRTGVTASSIASTSPPNPPASRMTASATKPRLLPPAPYYVATSLSSIHN